MCKVQELRQRQDALASELQVGIWASGEGGMSCVRGLKIGALKIGGFTLGLRLREILGSLSRSSSLKLNPKILQP